MPDELLMIPMDAKLIRQVLINLLDNAIKHTLPDGDIHISVEKDENSHFAVFKITDSGSGISQEDLPHLFQMFYTSRTQIADAKHGIGLGLTICDAIIKAHGGTIEAKNRNDRTGAEFTFTLPMEVQMYEQLS
jgi:two-component system sensor histidine kinase KdpD